MQLELVISKQTIFGHSTLPEVGIIKHRSIKELEYSQSSLMRSEIMLSVVYFYPLMLMLSVYLCPKVRPNNLNCNSYNLTLIRATIKAIGFWMPLMIKMFYS